MHNTTHPVNGASNALRQKALSIGIFAAMGTLYGTVAWAQQSPPTTQAQSANPVQKLQTIEVTGSHIRNIDVASSNPVTVIDSKQILNTGKQSLGEILQQLPANAGNTLGPQVDSSGGGDGSGSVSLRGLGSQRTLVLIDGHRYLNTDLNTIPVQIIDRVEVLKDGASATYGSDAIGGVVNIILKKRYKGFQVSANYGTTSRHDGQSAGANLLYGYSGDKGSIVFDVDYNKQDGIQSADRSFSKQALYLSSGQIVPTGSSRVPGGRLFMPPNLASSFGCGSVTLASGNGTSLDNYKCFNILNDAFNFQSYTWLYVPSERVSTYAHAEYQLADNVQFFADFLYNNTRAQEGDPPALLDMTASNIQISQYNMYNPFGVNFGGTNGYKALYRFSGIGQELTDFNTTTGQTTFGLRGTLGGWDWDAYFNYGHTRQNQTYNGYPVFTSGFRNGLGPSMLVNGVPTCVAIPNDPASAIQGCVPINMFNQRSAEVSDQIRPFFAALFGQNTSTRRAFYADATGPLFELPAGTVQAAVGIDYWKESEHNSVDSQRLSTATGTCNAPSSICDTDLQGAIDMKEAYAEVFVPILKDAPVIGSLNATLGDRYTKTSVAGSSTNYKVGLEWRPTKDLMARGTVTSVFRAPTIGNLYGGATGGTPALMDPCIGLSAAVLAQHPRACQGVPPDWVGPQVINTNVVREGAVAAGFALKPEQGKTFDFGLVYEPHYLPGMSAQLDFWRVALRDTLTRAVAQPVMNACFANDSGNMCGLVSRSAFDHTAFLRLPIINLGTLNVSGVDLDLHYSVPEMAFAPGRWSVDLRSTYISKAENDAIPGITIPTEFAGQYYEPFGNFPRIRALLNINWQMGPWNASWQAQFVGKSQDGSPDPRQQRTADVNLPNVPMKIASVLYNNLQVGYDIKRLHTTINAGVNNMFDRPPPLISTQDVLDATSDASTYDFMGRSYWLRATVHF